jgi:beta-glucosidase/6-phospho-beta-glucosidase/beta-galactosidase
VLSYTGLLQVVLNMIEAQRVAYDAIKQWDRPGCDRDGDERARGRGHQPHLLRALQPGSANDQLGAQHATYLYDRLFPNAIFLGDVDSNANGTIEPGEHRPELVGHADFFGLNYYFRGRR